MENIQFNRKNTIANSSVLPEKVDSISCWFTNKGKLKSAEQLKEIINKTNLLDGHCASCAICTLLYFADLGLYEAIKHYGDYTNSGFDKAFQPFSTKLYGQKDKQNQTIRMINLHGSSDNGFVLYKSFNDFKFAVEEEIKKLCDDQYFLLSISEAAHWIAAYKNKDKDIVFIDSQKGIEFNLYEQQEEYAPKTANLQIFPVSYEKLVEFSNIMKNYTNYITHTN